MCFLIINKEEGSMKKLMFGLLIGLLCIATIAGSTGVLAYVEAQ